MGGPKNLAVVVAVLSYARRRLFASLKVTTLPVTLNTYGAGNRLGAQSHSKSAR